jgi:GT2 family glycosyltransferase
MTLTSSDMSVVICAYTEARWNDLVAAVESVRQQQVPPREIIVVIDHNPALLAWAHSHFSGVIVTENKEAPGLSGARNCGAAVARGPVIAFLDDDAVAAPDWLEQLSSGCNRPHILGVGGALEPVWQAGRPAWFPEEFDWVVGCTYRGLPQTLAPVRNLLGGSMCLRHELFEVLGGFRHEMGRVGVRPSGCEETEFCIRAGQHWPQGVLLYQPRARVYHQVPPQRASWHYFWTRCYAEGRSKAQVSKLVGAWAGLATERTYTWQTLPQGVMRDVADTVWRHDPMGLARAGAIIAGLFFTTAGYLTGIMSGWLTDNGQRLMNVEFVKKVRSFFRKRGGADAPQSPDFEPVRILEVDISRPLPAVPARAEATGQTYRRATTLVRWHGQPLGTVELNLDENGLTAPAYARQIWRTFGAEITAGLRRHGVTPVSRLEAGGLPDVGTSEPTSWLVTKLPPVTVIVATRDRPTSLARCLDSLLALDYPSYEILVVDNAPSTAATADLIGQTYGHRVRYLREDRPGLANAHNRGLAEVRTPLVAFTDDDVVVDARWLTALVQGFQVAENVACVTGLILPAALETPAQVWSEQFGGFSKGFTRRIFDLDRNRPHNRLYPYAAGRFGSGASMAFKTAVLREMGGFDPALGTGSPTLGGDDLDAFFQIITRGYQLVYEPAALMYHFHRSDYAGLQRQVYGYGVGLTAFLMKSLLNRPELFLDFMVRIPAGLVYALNPHSPKNIKKLAGHYPKQLTGIELKGMLYGPFAYLHSRRQIRTISKPPLAGPPLTSPSSPALANEGPQL